MRTKSILLSAMCIALAFGVQAQDSFTNGLIAFYPFNGNANDESGNGNNATLAGNYQFVTNEIGQLAFRGIGDGALYYSGGGHVLLPTFDTNLNASFTLSVWVKDEVPVVMNAFSEDYISFGALGATLAAIEFAADVQTVRFWMIGEPQPIVASYSMSVDLQAYINSGWKNLVLAYQPGSFACYFNGQKLYETNVTINVFPVSYAALNRHWWNSGASSSARMSATYQNVRIYNRALSDSEVTQLYRYESLPILNLRKAVYLDSSNLRVGTNYQLQVSTDWNSWTDYGAAFTATNSTWRTTNYWDVDDWGQLFFRLHVVLP